MAVKTKAKKNNKPKAPKSRSSWRGMLRFGLVVFPVEAFNAHARGHKPIAFHQLHATCHSRIHYQKICPIHGEVSNDEIVSGYEYSPGHFVEFESEELDKLRSEKQRSLTIDTFITPEELDPIYFDGRMYFLAPASAEAKEPYAVLARALERLNRYGVGEIVLSGRKQVVLVRPYEGSLQMAMLNYAAQIEQPAAAKPARVTVSDKSLELAEELIESWTEKHFDFAHYVDRFEEDIRKLIGAKVHGHDITVSEVEEEPAVYNLMDALRKSMAHNRQKHEAAARPSNGRRGAPAARHKRKSGRRRAS
ncbi:MAG TPA: Ku protein [Planctomycetaceae bacterium]|jgi:DNA end-binding protein Ku|nr:Ku protein [Planctomycetaceae bacterium]